jgi:hypothetical protein
MARRSGVSAGVLRRGGITTADVLAYQAPPQVHPLTADGGTVGTDRFEVVRHRRERRRLQVYTAAHVEFLSVGTILPRGVKVRAARSCDDAAPPPGATGRSPES